MRLKAGAIREMHWHKEAEWAFILKGRARVTSVDQNLCTIRMMPARVTGGSSTS
ncbi:MAG: cupin domain-containing protein [Candidatus Sulfotelmatobacter sp.]|jgi:oxalate decarboxylase/phosphoglucose isomerase-like protein (cupin superfamily)